MSHSPTIEHPTLDPEYAALWTACQAPPSFVMEVESGRQIFKNVVIPLLEEKLAPLLPHCKF